MKKYLIIIMTLIGMGEVFAQTKQDIYIASKRINESFAEDHSTEYIADFLQADSISIIIRHSLTNKKETLQLTADKKYDFFNKPQLFSTATRRKSEYFTVDDNCYQFFNEGISHNSWYLEKLCYINTPHKMQLSEIYILDGD
ncbi:hypothetical protein KGI96_04065 [Phocoenobacter atlanticus subsp. cyclopteri]|nr:hypothetical protein [Pasteurella atlantica]QVE21568.1 hypothetical protein KGI96_04065 [Pasteurella atlantica]